MPTKTKRKPIITRERANALDAAKGRRKLTKTEQGELNRYTRKHPNRVSRKSRSR